MIKQKITFFILSILFTVSSVMPIDGVLAVQGSLAAIFFIVKGVEYLTKEENDTKTTSDREITMRKLDKVERDYETRMQDDKLKKSKSN